MKGILFVYVVFLAVAAILVIIDIVIVSTYPLVRGDGNKAIIGSSHDALLFHHFTYAATAIVVKDIGIVNK